MRRVGPLLATAMLALGCYTPAHAQFTALPSPSPYGGFGNYGLTSGYTYTAGYGMGGYGLGGYGLGGYGLGGYGLGGYGLGGYGFGAGYGYGLGSGYVPGAAATLGAYGLGPAYAPAYSYWPSLGNYGTGLGYNGTGQAVNPAVSYYYTPTLTGPSYVAPSQPYLGSLGIYDSLPFGYQMYQPTTNLIPAYGLYGANWRQNYYQQRAALKPAR